MSVPKTSAAAHNADELQRNYYESTASRYDELHLYEPEHNIALRYISALLDSLDVRRILDVGCGTGRGVADLHRLHPEVKIFGIDPVRTLLNQAVMKGVPSSVLVRGDGYCLPFHNNTFDVVTALGVLHHVAQPEVVVGEMMRVASKGIFISDGNLFGQGRIPIRVLKFLVYEVGLWKMLKKIQTGSRGYMISEGDGLAYSYSAFFHYGMLAKWADRVFVIPTTSESKEWRWPMQPLNHRSILLCAIRE